MDEEDEFWDFYSALGSLLTVHSILNQYLTQDYEKLPLGLQHAIEKAAGQAAIILLELGD